MYDGINYLRRIGLLLELKRLPVVSISLMEVFAIEERF